MTTYDQWKLRSPDDERERFDPEPKRYTLTWTEHGEELSTTMTSRDGAFGMYEEMKGDDDVTAAELDCDGLTLACFDKGGC